MAGTIQKLTTLDFSPGIRAKDINDNFSLIKRWIDSERLRSAGWGIVEGFELTKDLPNYSVNVSAGIIINEDGEEIKVDEAKLFAGEPSFRNITEELTVQPGGIIELQFIPYSNIYKRTIYYNPPAESFFDETELTVLDIELSKQLSLKDIRAIAENIITVNSNYVGKKLKITYQYANDRIDGILIKKDGSDYIYEQGIISTSPSQQIIQDYLVAGYYLIGFAYWHVGSIIDVEFITKDRSLRSIFVDKSGRIFLQGKEYTGNKFIYFTEPEYPDENELWYNVEEDILYIWRPDKNNKFSWIPVNDLSRFNRDYGCFTAEECPRDLRTFTFDDKTNLKFVPGKNQLTIIVDQIVVMRDQYDELYTEAKYDKNVCTGYGFKLKEPLERPSVVEVYVDHNVNTKAQNLELFPHISAFVDSDAITIMENEVAGAMFEVDSEYEIGNHQLEVWLNGKYLRINKDFVEMTKDDVEASIENIGELTNGFKLKCPLKNNDEVIYKVTRFMATYDNFRKVTDTLNEKVDTAVENLDQSKKELDTVISETSKTIDDLKVRVKTNEDSIKSLDETKLSKVAIKNLDTDLKNKIVRGKKNIIINLLSSEINVPDVTQNDHVSLFYIGSQTQRYILIKDEDYVIQSNSDGSGIIIELDPKWLGDQNAKIYMEAILIGVE